MGFDDYYFEISAWTNIRSDGGIYLKFDAWNLEFHLAPLREKQGDSSTPLRCARKTRK